MDGYCPFADDGRCRPNCMMMLVWTDKFTVVSDTDHGEGMCSFSVLASHVASQKHFGGNYLTQSMVFDNREPE